MRESLHHFRATWDPIWPFLFGHTPLTGRKCHTVVYVFFQQHVENIWVIYANDRKVMAIRAKTAKYGSLTETKQPYGVPGSLLVTDD